MRPGWDQYFLDIARQVAERSTCTRLAVGALVVRDRQILASGYNGAPSGMPHCLDVGCDTWISYPSSSFPPWSEVHCKRVVHAEINAITQAAKHGTRIEGAEIYVTHTPCRPCAMVLLNTGLSTIVYGKPYHVEQIEALLSGTPLCLRSEPA